jgi:hypothetical protein
VHAKFNGRSKWLTPETTLSDYIHKYAPKSDGNKPVEYTEFMANKFNQVLGENVITKDTPVVDIKEALMEAGLDPEHTITQAHLSMENPRVLKDLGIVYGEGAIDRKPMPPVRQARAAEKETETNFDPQNLFSTPNLGQPTPLIQKPEPKTEVRPNPKVVNKKAEIAKPLIREKVAEAIEKKYKIKPTKEQLDILVNPNINAVDKAKKLGIIKNNTTNIEDESIIESISNTISETYSGVTEAASDATEQISNWWDRKSAKTSDVAEPTVAKEVLPVNTTRNFSRAIGEKIKRNDRKYYTPEVIDLNQNSFGIRNRGDVTPLETEGAVITTFYPFKKASAIKNEKIAGNATFIGVDDNGALKVGNIKEFNDADQVSRVFSNKVIDFVYNPDGTIKLAKKNEDNPNNPVPVVKIKTDAGKIVEGHINFLTKEGIKNPYDQYGSIQGGRTILKTKDKTVLVSGSVNNLAVEFNKLKKTTKDPIEIITLDNGSYNLGLRTYDRKLTSKDLKSHDLQNRGGGNFIYLKGYAQENYQTPNIRTKEDESYKKGHPLVNEAKAIVLHHTAYEEPTLDNVHKAFMTPKSNSSHVVINYDGSRIKYAEPEQVTFHAGESKFMNRDNVNDFSIGVEFQGDTNKKPLTEDQINSAIDYLLPIIKKNRIPINNITTHAIIANERKADINEQEYNKFLNALKKRYYSKR